MAVRLVGQKRMNHIVSHEDGVKASVRAKAVEIGSLAQAILAGHRDEGHAYISVTYGDTDSFVNLEDKAAMSIEFGHKHNFTGKDVRALHIITGAAGLR